jgi:hypothetical protein
VSRSRILQGRVPGERAIHAHCARQSSTDCPSKRRDGFPERSAKTATPTSASRARTGRRARLSLAEGGGHERLQRRVGGGADGDDSPVSPRFMRVRDPARHRSRRHGRATAVFAGVLALVLARVATLGKARAGLLARLRLGRPSSPSRTDVVRALLATGALLAMSWHLAPWRFLGGGLARLAFANALAAATVVALERARALPWSRAKGWRRVVEWIGMAFSVAMTALALARW